MTQPARYYPFKGPRVTLLDVHSLIHQLNAALALPSGEDFTLDMNEVEYLGGCGGGPYQRQNSYEKVAVLVSI